MNFRKKWQYCSFILISIIEGRQCILGNVSYYKFTQWHAQIHCRLHPSLWLLYCTLKTVSGENVRTCHLVKFQLHTALTQPWHCPSELGNIGLMARKNWTLFVSAADSSLEYIQQGEYVIIGLPLFDADWLHLGHIKALNHCVTPENVAIMSTNQRCKVWLQNWQEE